MNETGHNYPVLSRNSDNTAFVYPFFLQAIDSVMSLAKAPQQFRYSEA